MKWERDYATGEWICAVCGAPRAGRSQCCRTPPPISLEVFIQTVFPDMDMTRRENRITARDFYDDYRHSDCQSMAEYVKLIAAGSLDPQA